jgi:hypothetical protein
MKAMTLTDAKGALELVCSKCTRHEYFPAPDRREAYMRAALKGWLQRLDTVEKKLIATICPRCAR